MDKVWMGRKGWIGRIHVEVVACDLDAPPRDQLRVKVIAPEMDIAIGARITCSLAEVSAESIMHGLDEPIMGCAQGTTGTYDERDQT